MNTEAPQQSNGNSSAKIISGVVAIILVLYLGYHWLFAIIGILVCAWILGKILGDKTHPMGMAIAIQSYQFLWLLPGFFIFGPSAELIIEALVFAGVIFWLFKRPGVIPVVILVIYQIIGFINNLSIISGVRFSFDSILHKTAFLNFIIRAGAIFFMIYGLKNVQQQFRKSGDAPAETDA